jgi:signal transduction histidine kinase/ligand-binding sensor domain-containing protein
VIFCLPDVVSFANQAMPKFFNYLFTLLLLHAANGFAQSLSAGFLFTQPVFQNYTMKNGLASNYCYDLEQDDKGRIWVATLNGLSRFNGTYWQNYQQQSSIVKHRIPANWVVDLAGSHGRYIYANTDRGFCIIDVEHDSVITPDQRKAGWGKICAGWTNRLFVSSWSGIDQYEVAGSTIKRLPSLPGTSGNSITQLYCDATNTIWACPEDNPSLISYSVPDGKFNYNKNLYFKGREVVVHSLCELDADWLLLCTKTHGLLQYSRKSGMLFSQDAGAYNSLTYLCATVYKSGAEKYIVAGTLEAGLVIIDQYTGQVYNCRADLNNPQSLCGNQINNIKTDQTGGLWIATNQGLSYFHPSLQQNKLLYFYNIPGYPDRAQLNAAAFISTDTLLLGTDHNGLFLCTNNFRTMQQVHLGHSDSVSIRTITKLKTGVWLIATSDGLYSISRPHLNKAMPVNTFPEMRMSVLHVATLNDSLAAICTHSGVVVWNLRSGSILLNEPRNDPSPITKDVIIHGNALWILRFFNGPDHYDLATRKKKPATPGVLKNLAVDYHMLVSCNNDVLISSTYGLIRYLNGNPNEYKLYNSSNGLDGDVVEQLATGFSGIELVYNTRAGLYLFNLNTEINTRVTQYENYNQKWYNQLSIIPEGLVVCTVGDHLLLSNYPQLGPIFGNGSATITEKIMVNDLLVSPYSNYFELPYNENNIAFQFAMPIYTDAGKQYFQYRILPGDSSWKTSHDGAIRFFNLAPNNYTLTIKSFSGAGVLADLKQYSINISLPFYKTLWFYLLLMLVASGGVLLLLYYRQRQREKISIIRNQISRDLHDELGANVSSIHIMARMLAQQGGPEKMRPMLDKISEYSVQVSNTINDIIWNVNPKFDSVAELLQKMTRYASESLEASGISYSVEQPENIPAISLNSKLKYNFFLIFKEAVNNAAKYSNAHEVIIRFNCTTRALQFELHDNGVGIADEQRSKGNGLGNMAARAAAIDATLKIDTAPAKGTQISLTVKY